MTEAPLRLRVAGMVLAAGLAMVWDDRCAVVTAATPVGLPAVRRGRLAVVLALLALAWLLSRAAVGGQRIAFAAITFQTVAMAAVLLALVGWFARGRDDEPLLALPVPALLLTGAIIGQLPRGVSLLHSPPGGAGWPVERTRWLVLLLVSIVVVGRFDRDPAKR